MDIRETTSKTDFNFILLIFTLTIISLINLYSATHGLGADSLSRTFLAQAVWYGAGWVLFGIVTLINLEVIKRLVWPIYFCNLVFLLAVKLFGKSFYGAQRWLDFGFFRFQPSETMKVALVLVLASVLSKKLSQNSLGLKDLIFPIVICLIPFGLTVIQPDLGTALVMGVIAASMALFTGINKKILLSLLVIVPLSLPIVWTYGLKGYQKQRVLTFVNPGKDLRGGGYNSRQSKIAVGSGMLIGRGFRKGTQSQLEFLPERHTDFIFSVLSEEHGFVGSVFVVLLFLFLFLNLTNIAQLSPDPFGSLVAIGIGSLIFWHFFINLGMITGMLPVVGVPLPFFSYGGSSILTTMAALGLVSSIARKRSLF